MSLIKDFENQGCKVRVRHFREKQYIFETPQRNRGLCATLCRVDYAPRGGETQIIIQTPEGLVIEGTAHCRNNEIFCRRDGRDVALYRCIQQLREFKSKGFITPNIPDGVELDQMEKSLKVRKLLKN